MYNQQPLQELKDNIQRKNYHYFKTRTLSCVEKHFQQYDVCLEAEGWQFETPL